jgi:hypothetical protein
MKTIRLIIILAAMLLTLTIVLVFSRPVQAPVQARTVCMLPSVENGYVETSLPVRCVNDPQRTATQADIAAGIYAPSNAMQQYEYWYATDAVLIHHSQYPCFVIRVDGFLLCDPREYDGDIVEPTDAQLQDWQDYQRTMGGACIYIEPDQCDNPN